METDFDPPAHTRTTPAMGALIVLAIASGVIVYLVIGKLLGIVPLYAGFAFAIYFGGFRHCDPRELAAAFVGSLGGVFFAALLYTLPKAWGTAGSTITLFLVFASLYALVMSWVAILVNQAFMLLLTIATIPPVQAEARFTGMACSIVLAGVMLGGGSLVWETVVKRKDSPDIKQTRRTV